MQRKEFTLPAKQLKAASFFVSDKDVRHSLQGVHINSESNAIEATDGHTLFSAKSIYPLDDVESMIVLLDGKIPDSADLARFYIVENQHQQLDFCEEPSGYMWFEDESGDPVTKKNGIKETCLFRLIQADYPDLSKLLFKGNKEAIDGIAIDPALMGKVSKACKVLGVTQGIPLDFYGQTESIGVHLSAERALSETTILIMPCREPEPNKHQD